MLQHNEINCDNAEDSYSDSNNCYEYHEIAYHECDEIELENSSDETASEDEEENHSRCLISWYSCTFVICMCSNLVFQI